MEFTYPWQFNSRRSAVMSPNGMVATSHPLAANVGIHLLEQGGTAADAAVGTAAMLNLVEPHNTGIGGDVFALTHFSGAYRALNGSGGAPRGATIDSYERAIEASGGRTPEIPKTGGLSVTVPGALDGWHRLLSRYGSFTLRRVLQPVIEYARSGVLVTEHVAHRWNDLADKIDQLNRMSNAFLRDGRPLRPGEYYRNPALADTFEAVGREGIELLYGGRIGREIVETVHEHGGMLTMEDLELHQGEWTEPICTSYRGTDVLEHPPNGQGAIALQALNITERFDLGTEPTCPDRLHTLIEILKLSMADGHRYISDPEYTKIPLETMLSKEYAADRASDIGDESRSYGPKASPWGDTVYVSVVDSDRNAVSLINSLYYGFGSGLVVRGFPLHNRGYSFSLDPKHSNSLEPGKRPFHTIIPAMLRKDGEFRAAFGVCGGAMQPQAHVQLLANMVDSRYNPQAALDVPRFRILETDEVALETSRLPEKTVTELQRRGHDVVDEKTFFQERGRDWGSGQIIYRTGDGLIGGADPRRDGSVVGY